jgi:hypothetical protein
VEGVSKSQLGLAANPVGIEALAAARPGFLQRNGVEASARPHDFR